MIIIITDEKHVIVLSEEWIQKALSETQGSRSPKYNKMTLDNMAYVVYSSGTTGKPKGMWYIPLVPLVGYSNCQLSTMTFSPW